MAISKVNKETGDLIPVAGTYIPNASGIAYDNTESGLTSGNVQSAIDEVNARIPTAEIAITSPYTKLGFEIGCAPGLLRSRTEPVKCMLFLGNSLTGCHLTYTSGGKSIDELREVGATHPNSGWISLVRNYLVTIYPDIKVYKTNAAIWEQTTHATGRSYDLIKDLEIYEVTENGAFEVPGLTVKDVLPQADVVSVQLYENVSDCTTNANTPELASDYQSLFASMKEVNPNAYYSLFFGFWYAFNKAAAVLNVTPGINVWGVPTFLPYRISDYYCGEAMQYGIGGEEIRTITPEAATHPSDWGFYLMAVNYLFSLFNATNKNTLKVYTPQETKISDRLPVWGEYSIFTPPAQSSLDFNTDMSYDDGDPIADRYYLFVPGVYDCGLKTTKNKVFGIPDMGPGYGLAKVSFLSGSYSFDFDTSWIYNTTVSRGFTIRQSLLYAINPDFPKTFEGKYLANSWGWEDAHTIGSLDANNMTPYLPTGFPIGNTDNSLEIAGICRAGDSNFPADALNSWFRLKTVMLEQNQGMQILVTIKGGRFIRNRLPNAWTAWKALP